MVASLSAGTSARYYTSLTAYYTETREPRGKWLLVGLDTGIAAGETVATADFERLHDGLDRDGRSLLPEQATRAQRIGGYDLTFSAPKSVSVLWGLADEEVRTRIEAAHEVAIVAALTMLEKNAAFCRMGKGGIERVPTRLTVAAFRHGDARPAEHSDGEVFSDPNVHTHGIILNLGPKPGAVGALDGKALFAWKMAAGASYHAELAKQLGDLGLSIEPTGSNGLFEIAGIDAGLRDYFSARRRGIEDELDKHGLESRQAPALAAEITRATRKAKHDLESEDRFAAWRRHAQGLGFDPDTLVRAAFQGLEADAPKIDVERREADLRAEIDVLPRTLTETESVFEYRHLHAVVASALVGTGQPAARVEQEIDRLTKSNAVVALGHDVWGHAVLSTPEMVAIERDIGRMVGDLGRLRSTAPDPALVERLIATASLGAEQTAAVRAATLGETVTIIEGAPGSGKTTTLRPVKEAWEAAGYRVIGSATAWKIANMLRDDLGIEARATDSWLAKEAAGQPFLDEKTVLVLDEAGLLSSRQMHAVLSAFRSVARDGATPKLVLVGDRDQLQAVGAGSGLRLVADAVEAQRVEAIQRQREPWLRDAILAFGRGEAEVGLKAFSDRGHVRHHPDRAATISGLVDRWEAATAAAPEKSTLMIAATNADVRAISHEVRQRLRRDGALRGEDIVVAARSPSGQNVALPLAVGDHIRFLRRADLEGHQIINGTEATVVGLSKERTGEVRIVARIGEKLVSFTTAEIADARGRAEIAHAYCSTIYGSQGRTTDQALVLMTPDMNRHAIYVAASRARDATEFFVDGKALDSRMRADLPLSERKPAVRFDEDAQRAYLAERLSRSGVKRTTLDVGQQSEAPGLAPTSRSHSERPRARSRGIDRSLTI